MLLEELAKDMVDVTSSLVGGRTINIMNTDGIIVASTERERIGTFHQGAREAVMTGKLVRIHKDQLNRYAGAKEGCNMPLRVNGNIIGVVGIYGNPEEIQEAYHQAVVLDTTSNASVNDISQVDTRCRYLISNTALQQAAFLDDLLQVLRNVFQEEELVIQLESVQKYYDCNKSVTEAAQKLFIHKNTLQYRIKRVLQVLEIGRLPAFRQEYLIRLLIDHYCRKSRSQDLEK